MARKVSVMVMTVLPLQHQVDASVVIDVYHHT